MITLEEKFGEIVLKMEDNGCLPWTGKIHENGYGLLYFQGKHHRAHRISYLLYYGNLPEGRDICHTCDNRKCVNPNHLWAGTRSENLRDMVSKNRHCKDKPSRSCQKHPRAKITNEQALEIRSRSQIESSRKLGKEFGLSHVMIQHIKHGRYWRHLDNQVETNE